MKRILFFCLLVNFISVGYSMPDPVKPKVLIMSKTNGFHHASIPVGIKAIQALGKANGFDVDTTTDSLSFNTKNLKQYKAIILLSTTGTIFGEEQKKALQKYIHQGGGIVGIHAATDCEYEWPWYNQMMGAYFDSHPQQQTAQLTIVNHEHLSTKPLPATWTRRDEWYNFKNISRDIQVLITIDESSYKGGKNGTFHPMAWYHSFEGGRVFYTELGHTDESYSEPLFLQHLLGGIQYAIASK